MRIFSKTFDKNFAKIVILDFFSIMREFMDRLITVN